MWSVEKGAEWVFCPHNGPLCFYLTVENGMCGGWHKFSMARSERGRNDLGAPDIAPVGPSATKDAKGSQIFDVVRRPVHYNSHPSGVECIEITEHMNYCLGNAFKYIWRADLKGKAIEDLKKAAFYIDREIERRTRLAGSD